MTRLIVLELNEVNFDFVKAYGAQGRLPELNRLIRDHGLAETSSERHYHEWEPWIQWVSAHSGQTLAQHGVFRLGDVVAGEIDQIWERLERCGLKVGALSPMNASNRLERPAFFLPDPWTQTPASGPRDVLGLYGVLARAVNGNASGKVSAQMACVLLLGLMRFARPANYFEYVRTLIGSVKTSWRRALFLDLFLGDLFISLVNRTRPDVATVFMNAAAHIQHHYLFSSAVYEGRIRNPAWYVDPSEDPILEIYRVYDRQVAAIRKAFPSARLMIATGLHQVPHAEETYYWRLSDHASFLTKAGVPFVAVQPLMSRDFVVQCGSASDAMETACLLEDARCDDGEPLFAVDNRGADLFVELVYSKNIESPLGWTLNGRHFDDLRAQVAFVAIKNGEHDGVGYFIDTAASPPTAVRFPLTELPARMADACGVSV